MFYPFDTTLFLQGQQHPFRSNSYKIKQSPRPLSFEKLRLRLREPVVIVRDAKLSME